MARQKKPLSFSEWSFRGLGYVLLFLFGMMCVIPFYLILISSFAEESSLIRNGFQLIPRQFSTRAYEMILSNPGRIGRAYRGQGPEPDRRSRRTVQRNHRAGEHFVLRLQQQRK